MSLNNDDNDIFGNPDDYNEYGVPNSGFILDELLVLPRMHPSPRSILILYHDLHLFVTKLKIEIASEGKDLPEDIFEKILSDILKKEKKQLIRLSLDEMNKFIVEHDYFIKTELKNRLTKMGIQYDESDNYVNVVNYAKAKGLKLNDEYDIVKDILNDEYDIEKEIELWLGTTDLILDKDQWGRSFWSGLNGRTQKIIETNKRLNGGAKLHKKKSRYIRKIRKNSKINKKN
jgi:hypothetical protein